MKNWKKKLFVVLALIMLLAFLLSFDAIAGPVGKALNAPIETIKNVAKTVLIVAIGLALVFIGASAGALIIGIPLVIVGVGLIAFGLWPLFGGSRGDTNPSNTNLNKPR